LVPPDVIPNPFNIQTIESCVDDEQSWFLAYDPSACASLLTLPMNHESV
jgi:hypothetical protein